MAEGKFGTCINCMDGRVQQPMIDWMKQKFGIDYVDMITEPGPDKIMAEGINPALESIKARTLISVNKHQSKVIVLVGHDDCAGNPVSKEEHIEHVRRGLRVIKNWQLKATIIGVWIGSDWRPEVIDTID